MMRSKTRRGRLLLATTVVLVLLLNAAPALAIGGRCIAEVHAGPVSLCL